MVLMEVIIHCDYFILHLHLDFHSLPELSLHWGRPPTPFDSTYPLVSISCLSPLVLEHCLYFTISLCFVYAMPHERGKPKRGSAYYSFVAQHRHSIPSLSLSLPPNPFTSYVGQPHSNQNWHHDAQLPLGNMDPMPQNFDPVITQGGCPIEEEIPPSWMEDIIVPTKPIVNSIPLSILRQLWVVV
jgi:hypothetical protein